MIRYEDGRTLLAWQGYRILYPVSCPYPMRLVSMLSIAAGDIMTSEERRQARYKRRRARREAKKPKATYEDVISLSALDKAADMASRGVGWKASVQRYNLSRMFNIYKTHMILKAGGDVRRGFICFDIRERGKLRHIQSVRIFERVAQKSLCTNALKPVLTKGLIYDNGASQEGKGTHFQMKRLKVHLIRHFNKHGRKGGILLIDFKDYFGNINHAKLKRIYERAFDDERVKKLAYSFIDAFDRGLGLGSEVSQISAITYPNRIDHYIKEVLRIKGYGRFMDDSYLIHEDKKYLEECLAVLKEYYREEGIVVNDKKTHILDLKHGIPFLKTRYYLTETGKVIMKPCRESITRERRKLKKQARLVNEGVMTYEQVRQSYQSWKGAMSHRDSYYTVRNMDRLFNELFIKEWRENQNG